MAMAPKDQKKDDKKGAKAAPAKDQKKK